MNGLLQHKENVLKETRGNDDVKFIAGYVQALVDISNTEYGDIE